MEQVKKRRKKNRYMTGEDIDMFREREHDYGQKKKAPICDTHIDGA